MSQASPPDSLSPRAAPPGPAAATDEPWRPRDWYFVAALALSVVLVYHAAWHGRLLWDDDSHVTRPELQSWQGLYRIWFDLGATQQYYPLLHSTFWFEHKLWGDAVLGYHLANILLHAAAAVLVALVLRRLKVPGAYLAAAIFALHPVQVESVAWITEQKNTLSAVFYLGAMLIYLRFDWTRRTPLYLAALALFVLGLLSKTVTATLPAGLLVIFWWQRGRLSWKRDVAPLVPFFAIGAVAGLFTAWVERKLIGAEGAAFDLTPVDRCLIAGRAIWFYLGKLFWPRELIFIYPRWHVSQAVWWQYAFPLAALLLLGLLWAVRRRWRGPLAGFLFFIGTLFPVLGFCNVFPFIYSFVADHFQYLAALGIITLTAAGLALLLGRRGLWNQPPAYAVSLGLLAILAGLSWQQSRRYADDETLFRATIAENPDCWMAQVWVGVFAGRRGQIDEAAAHFERALELKPDCALAQYDFGRTLADVGQSDEAMAHYQEALKINPRYADAHFSLAKVLAGRRRFDEAITHYEEAIDIRPDDANAHNNLGSALASCGRIDEAIVQYQKALEIKPDDTAARDNLGEAQLQRDSPGKTVEPGKAKIPQSEPAPPFDDNRRVLKSGNPAL